MDIYIIYGKEVMQIPILPPSYNFTEEGAHTSIRTVNYGEVTMLGKRNCKRLEFTSFFPGQDYPFARYRKDRHPKEYTKKLNSWTTKVVRVIITGANFNRECVISNFTYGEEDGTGDISYTIGFTEYRKPKYTKVGKLVKTTYVIKKGDTLKKIAKKLTGYSSYDQEIYKQNKSIIEKAAKKRGKKSSKRKGVPGGWLTVGTKLSISIIVKKE